MYLQELLVRKALRELGYRIEDGIEVDHLRGLTTVDGVELPILYPKSWVNKIIALRQHRRYRYGFVGMINDTGGRAEMLRPFAQRGSLIESTRFQRKKLIKGRFNTSYFRRMREFEFALCPMHTDWPGPPEYSWSYRFIEAAFAGAIPVLFRVAPLGDRFVDGFDLSWDDELDGVEYARDAAARNFTLAVERHVFPNALIKGLLARPDRAEL